MPGYLEGQQAFAAENSWFQVAKLQAHSHFPTFEVPDQIAARITQLQGEPDFDPDILTKRSHAEYVEGKNLLDMVRENLVAERVAIASYQEIIRWLGNEDPSTRRMLEGIVEVEEEHADDMLKLLEGLD